MDDVSFSVPAGSVLGVVGESGCGKSTLARLILGLLEPSAGDVLVDGQRLGGMDRRARARLIQPVFQDPFASLNPKRRIRDIVAMPLVAQGDVAPVHEALVTAAAGRDVWVVGGGDLAAQFAEAGLLGEVVVSIAPVTLGAGRPLFPRPFDFELVEFDRNRAFLCARYAVRGARPS